MKSLDTKIQKIRSDSYESKDFIIADAKDADMAMGIRAPGFIRNKDGSKSDKPDSFQNFLNKMQSLTESELEDVMLMSATAAERLVKKKINQDPVVLVQLHDCLIFLLQLQDVPGR